MQCGMGAFLNRMHDAAAIVAYPINSFTQRIGRRQFIILEVVLELIFLFLIDLRFQILCFFLMLVLMLLLFFLLLLIEGLLEPRPSHLAGNDPFAVGMVPVFLQ